MADVEIVKEEVCYPEHGVVDVGEKIIFVDHVDEFVEEIFVNNDDDDDNDDDDEGAEFINVESRYQCDFCEQTFESMHTLVTHRSQHMKCRHCDKIFCNALPYKLHVAAAHTVVETHLCAECPATFNQLENLQRHRRSHLTGRIVNFEQLQPQQQPQQQQQQQQQQGLPYECRICGCQFRAENELHVHLRAAHVKKNRKSFTLYECDYCGKCTTDKAALVKHIRVHTGEKPFACHHCGKRFRQNGYLRIHMRRHEEAPAQTAESMSAASFFQCDLCRAHYTSKRRLTAHIESHLHDGGGADKRYTCAYCAKRLVTRQTLLDHMKMHTKEGLFACDLCDKRYASAGNLRNHRRRHTDRRRPFACTHCDRRFTEKCNLQRHSRVHLEDGAGRRVACEYCQRRVTVAYYRVHLRVHTGERPYECQFCGRRFAQSTSLKDHLTVHTGEKRYECAACGRRFCHKSQYRRHVASQHEGDGEQGDGSSHHQCTVCEKWFDSESAMVNHVRVHTGEKPFQCAECGRRFSQRSNLNVHQEVHSTTRRRPFKCALCDTSYGTKSKLKDHLAVHRQERPFGCGQCDKRFKHRSTLNAHVLAHRRAEVQCGVCEKVFSTKSNLNRHIQKHIEEHIFY